MTMTLINDSGINYQPNQASAVEMWGAKVTDPSAPDPSAPY